MYIYFMLPLFALVAPIQEPREQNPALQELAEKATAAAERAEVAQGNAKKAQVDAQSAAVESQRAQAVAERAVARAERAVENSQESADEAAANATDAIEANDSATRAATLAAKANEGAATERTAAEVAAATATRAAAASDAAKERSAQAAQSANNAMATIQRLTDRLLQPPPYQPAWWDKWLARLDGVLNAGLAATLAGLALAAASFLSTVYSAAQQELQELQPPRRVDLNKPGDQVRFDQEQKEYTEKVQTITSRAILSTKFATERLVAAFVYFLCALSFNLLIDPMVVAESRPAWWLDGTFGTQDLLPIVDVVVPLLCLIVGMAHLLNAAPHLLRKVDVKVPRVLGWIRKHVNPWAKQVEELIEQLFDDDPKIRTKAANRLGNRKEESAVCALKQALEQDQDAAVRKASENALKQIDPTSPLEQRT